MITCCLHWAKRKLSAIDRAMVGMLSDASKGREVGRDCASDSGAGVEHALKAVEWGYLDATRRNP